MKAEVELNSQGIGTVKLDGIDVAPWIQRLSIFATARRGVELDLGLMTPENLHFVGDVEITIPESVRKILLHMGWTPPEAAVDE